MPGTGIRGDGENLHDRRSTQRVRGTSPRSAVLTGESSSRRPSFQVNVSGSGSGGSSSGGQVSACAGEERPSLFSDSGNHTRLSGHVRSWNRPHRRRRAIIISRWEWWWKSIRRDWYSLELSIGTFTGVIGVPDGGAIPGGGIGCPGFPVTLLPLLADAKQFQPTIVPSFGHVPSPCQYAPLSSPDVET